jgi:hypothetical protein
MSTPREGALPDRAETEGLSGEAIAPGPQDAPKNDSPPAEQAARPKMKPEVLQQAIQREAERAEEEAPAKSLTRDERNTAGANRHIEWLRAGQPDDAQAEQAAREVSEPFKPRWTTDRESIMQAWDRWRAAIAKGDGGSWPRDCFESLVDELLELREASAHPAAPQPAQHSSDCALHNAPAYPPGPCDCGADDRQECEALRGRMADLLSRTAVAIRGPEPPLTRWSWHDLPERAAAAIAAIDVMTRAAQIAAAPQPASANPWRQAVDDAKVAAGLDCLGPDEIPSEALADLIGHEVAMALDPAVSAAAQALIERGNSGGSAPGSGGSASAQAAEVPADARMLDWLATAGTVLISLVVDAPHDGEICVSGDESIGYGSDLRAAIRAAMSAPTPQEPKP